MLYKTLMISLVLVGCGSVDKVIDRGSEYKPYRPDNYPNGILNELVDYYNQFEQLYKEYNAAEFKPMPYIPSQFNELEGNVIGRCYWGSDWQYIDIDPTYWNSASPNEREALVFHELGHCYLKRDHIDATNKDNMPESIMYPNNIGGYTYYNNNKDSYYKELFNYE